MLNQSIVSPPKRQPFNAKIARYEAIDGSHFDCEIESEANMATNEHRRQKVVPAAEGETR